ncbi:interactor of constitutive active ROPs 3-like [Wolffia australiana]
MQKSKTRTGPSATAQKTSPILSTPRPTRQSKIAATESGSSMSNSSSTRSPNVKSPKPIEKKVSKSPASEKKPVSRMAKLESQLTQVQEDLKKTKNLLNSSESSKMQALEEANEAKKQYQAMAADFEDTKRQLLELSRSEDASSHNLDQEVDSEPNPSEGPKLLQKDPCELEKPEADYGELVSETHLQLQVANSTIQTLHSDGLKVVRAFKTTCSELETYKSQVSSLQSEINELQLALTASDAKLAEEQIKTSVQMCSAEQTVNLLKEEMARMREEANAKIAELTSVLAEKNQDLVSVTAANESLKRGAEKADEEVSEMKSKLSQYLGELDELKAKLAEKEARLRDVAAANEVSKGEILKLTEIQRNYGIETESALKVVAELKENLMDKETELQSISEENKALRAELQKKEQEIVDARELALSDLEAAKALQRDALLKLDCATDDVEKSNQRASKAAEQLEAARVANLEMELELKRMRVQTEQWRKAADAAATILNAGTNGKVCDKSGPIEADYIGYGGKVSSSPYSDDQDGDSAAKTKKTMLKKIGVLWKKGQK